MPKRMRESSLPAKPASAEIPFLKRLTIPSNVVKAYDQNQRGFNGYAGKLKCLIENLVARRVSNYEVWCYSHSFARRITAVSWHPSRRSVVVVGSKGGELSLTNLANRKDLGVFNEGIGPGGSILGIAFDPFTNYDSCYLATLDGCIKKWNYETNTFSYLLETNTYEKWFCSVAVSKEAGLTSAGDTEGYLHLISKDDKIVSKKKIHKGKLTGTDFAKINGWILATCSLDKTVKIWDLRKLDEKKPLETLHHNKGLNSAVFSCTGSDRLLTTDQYDELRIYKSPLWSYETKIRHPHRQFQHLTQIKASWHPCTDIVVVGRYPDPAFPSYFKDEPRSVDVFSATSGKLLTQMISPEIKGIMSLNVFNSTGEYLASGMGVHLPIWRWKDQSSLGISKKGDKTGWEGGESDDDDNDAPRKPPPKPKLKTKKGSGKGGEKTGSSAPK